MGRCGQLKPTSLRCVPRHTHNAIVMEYNAIDGEDTHAPAILTSIKSTVLYLIGSNTRRGVLYQRVGAINALVLGVIILLCCP